ncbi:hypothetical protein L1049_012877 [Liquidambar formosana]|uniref:Nucleoplasmin-like domain-containing protein n=1 Tax=Liquidambar formosana TaxID=63359 RepID=A0AAP0RLW2_LIQFO
MEFWGIEVKAGEPFKVTPGEEKIIHLSQASLGESKKDKGNDSVPLFLKFDDQKIVLGTLSTEKYPQISFDLLFEKEFELSHNWKNGSVYFCGYKTDIPDQEGYSDFDSSEEEEFDIPLTNALSGKPVPKVEQVKPANAKAELKVVEPTDEDEDESTDDDDSSDDEDMLLAGDESEDGDADTEDDEETPKKAESGKKRPSESALKTPVPAKKGKLATPQKTGNLLGPFLFTETCCHFLLLIIPFLSLFCDKTFFFYMHIDYKKIMMLFFFSFPLFNLIFTLISFHNIFLFELV